MWKQVMNRIEETGIVSIIRGIDEIKIIEIVEALYEGGIKTIEITFDTPGAARMIEKVKNKYMDEITIGAGTVLDTETARIAILSGAEFILSPSLNTKVIEVCNRYGKIPVPGVLTPTEIVAAMEAGAKIVKIFPARAFGPTYVKDIKGPLKQIEIMSVGGVTIGNAGEFIKNGSIALGIGSELVNLKVIAEGNYSLITKKAAEFLDKVRAARV